MTDIIAFISIAIVVAFIIYMFVSTIIEIKKLNKKLDKDTEEAIKVLKEEREETLKALNEWENLNEDNAIDPIPDIIKKQKNFIKAADFAIKELEKK